MSACVMRASTSTVAARSSVASKASKRSSVVAAAADRKMWYVCSICVEGLKGCTRLSFAWSTTASHAMRAPSRHHHHRCVSRGDTMGDGYISRGLSRRSRRRGTSRCVDTGMGCANTHTLDASCAGVERSSSSFMRVLTDAWFHAFAGFRNRTTLRRTSTGRSRVITGLTRSASALIRSD